MKDSVLLLAKRILYFNEDTKNKESIYQIFCKAWEIIPIGKQNKIKDKVELIIVGPYEDCGAKSSPPIAVTNNSPIKPGTYRINWNPEALPINNNDILLHEFAHVVLDHPKKFILDIPKKDLSSYIRQKEENSKIADLEANIEIAKWKKSFIKKRNL
jgi:hypothetical protein